MCLCSSAARREADRKANCRRSATSCAGAIHRGLVQRENVETYTLRHTPDENALPMRQLLSFLPGFGVGGGASHWNGQTWRFQTTDYCPALPSRAALRQGRDSGRHDGAGLGGHATRSSSRTTCCSRSCSASRARPATSKARSKTAATRSSHGAAEEFPLPPLEPSEAGLIFKAATEKLGYKPFPLPAANASRAYTNPDGMKLGACQYCGHCERFVCEANAKASPNLLLFPLVADKPNFEMRTHAEVFLLNYDKEAARVIRRHLHRYAERRGIHCSLRQPSCSAAMCCPIPG